MVEATNFGVYDSNEELDEEDDYELNAAWNLAEEGCLNKVESGSTATGAFALQEILNPGRAAIAESKHFNILDVKDFEL